MRLIFVRHAEPNYELDTITPKGWREAECLAQRVAGWNVQQVYCSPLGRAQDTASLPLKALRQQAITLDFIQEFKGRIIDPSSGKEVICWDILPERWIDDPLFFDKDRWSECEIFKGTNCLKEYRYVTGKFDELLAGYGYHRCGSGYRVDEHREDTIVLFCHLGVTCVILSHLLGISPMLALHSFFIPASSVTIVQSEERTAGLARFRCQSVGDTSHLYNGGEPVSHMASFAVPFQERDYPR